MSAIDGCIYSAPCANVGGTLYELFDVDSNGNICLGMGVRPSTNAFVSVARAVQATPSQTRNFKVVDCADTARTASTEFLNAHFSANVVRTWGTGALALQRDHLFEGGAVAFVGASTCAQAATVGIGSAPTAGTNCTLTDTYGLLTAASVRSGFGGQIVGNLAGLPVGTLPYAFPSDANQTLTTSQSANPLLIISGTQTSRTLSVTGVTGSLWLVVNTTASGLTIAAQSGTGITIATTKAAIVAWDGTNMRRVTADA